MRSALAQFPEYMETSENDYIDCWRQRNGRPNTLSRTGLALSGGGIRSAVFCLGVLQALASKGILQRFDYLSTVSGGGYIGSSLTWFTRKGTAFGVAAQNFPYGIDDPNKLTAQPSSGGYLLPHLRRHGSYLDPGGPLSILPGIAVVLRGLVLNLCVIWLPIAVAIFCTIRAACRITGSYLAGQGMNWPLRPWMVVAIPTAIFVVLSILYSVFSGLRAWGHRDTPYAFRKGFERVAPPLLSALAFCFVLGSLPYVSGIIHDRVASEGAVGFAMAAAGAIAGLWSRFTSKGSGSLPVWVGTIASAVLIYGIALLAYWLSGFLFIQNHPIPDRLSPVYLAIIPLMAIAIGLVVDLNETTLHRFYRDRLMEAFMPDLAVDGRPRKKHAEKADAEPLYKMCAKGEERAPYHLICAHLVLTRVTRQRTGIARRCSRFLGGAPDAPPLKEGWADRWRLRGGDSFIFSPRFCGAEAVGWYRTEENKAFSKVSLPTAMAASGAAVNPNAASSGMGPQRNVLFATLMALMNIRLGIWLPNPWRFEKRKHARAPNHFNAGLAGVFDRLSQTGRFLEIADGGNFENLGVYELLRRKVRTMVVCDATADPKTAFADLQNLLSRAEADFGVTINFSPPPLKDLMPSKEDARFPLGVAFAKQPFVVGSISYLGDKAPSGKIFYVKPTIFEALRLHLLGYKGAYPDFPDDSTVDQFFDEARFEAYRELGFACVEALLQDREIKETLRRM